MKKNERELRSMVQKEPEVARRDQVVVVTGGAGFIGCNVAHRLLSQGERVLVFDNLSRPGVERNLQWLQQTHGDAVAADVADVRDATALRKAIARASHVFHFAAQVAVTTSLDDPLTDFSINAGGTFNVLEAIREQDNPPSLIFTSTNKVYGGLDDLPLVRTGRRYEPKDEALRIAGISERRSLDFHSPYGCSKGTADQYVLDYARSFGLRTAVFRMSCIYGPHQYGTEDQGWVAHFLLQALAGRPIVLYGDGMQVRDVLFVEDLVDAFMAARQNIEELAGQAFNIGGGPANTTSLLELVDLIASIHGSRPEISYNGWRTGDQRYYVSDTKRFQQATGWAPKVGVVEGVRRLHDWLVESGTAEQLARRTARRRLVLHTPSSDNAEQPLVAEGGAQ